MNGEHEEGKKINKRVVDMLERNCVGSRGFREDNYMNGCHSYLLHLQVFALISCQDPSDTRALRDVVTEPQGCCRLNIQTISLKSFTVVLFNLAYNIRSVRYLVIAFQFLSTLSKNYRTDWAGILYSGIDLIRPNRYSSGLCIGLP